MILLMNRDAIMINESLANLFEWYIKTIIYHDHMGIIPGIQVQFINQKSSGVIYQFNWIKKTYHFKRYMNMFDKTQDPFIIKKYLSKLRNRNYFLTW